MPVGYNIATPVEWLNINANKCCSALHAYTQCQQVLLCMHTHNHHTFILLLNNQSESSHGGTKIKIGEFS